MFFQNRPMAGVTPFRRGNGSGGALDAALAEVSRMEDLLTAARSAARACAKREGRSAANLFAESRFILRATGERWVETARAGHDALVDALFRSAGLDPAKERAAAAASLKENETAQRVKLAKWKAVLRDSGYDEARAAGDYELAGEIMAKLCAESKAQTTGQQIVAAARKARMAVADDEVPQPTGLAKKIIEAAKKARGEV